MNTPTTSSDTGCTLLNKVPEVTLYFWLIKILCTTVGETAADYLNDTLGWGLSRTSLFMAVLLGASLAVQLGARRYVAPVYWVAVVLISVVGTLITDNLTDDLGVSLWISTAAFAIALAGVFATWYRVEGTLSIHSVTTPRREGFYWLAVLVTFALGTAAGDLFAEQIGVGYGPSVLVFAAMIAVVTAGWWRLGLGAVTAFWAAYVLTRPLGASIGDLTSQPAHDGGLGWGTTGTSLVFLSAIVVLVGYLTLTRVDRTEIPQP
jgi:uncharacterized membrane-anchored protein